MTPPPGLTGLIYSGVWLSHTVTSSTPSWTVRFCPMYGVTDILREVFTQDSGLLPLAFPSRKNPAVTSSFFLPFFLFYFCTFPSCPFRRKVGGSRSPEKNPPWCASSTRLPNWNSRLRVFCNPFLFNPAYALLHASPTTYVPPTSEGSHHGPTREVVQQRNNPIVVETCRTLPR